MSVVHIETERRRVMCVFFVILFEGHLFTTAWLVLTHKYQCFWNGIFFFKPGPIKLTFSATECNFQSFILNERFALLFDFFRAFLKWSVLLELVKKNPNLMKPLCFPCGALSLKIDFCLPNCSLTISRNYTKTFAHYLLKDVLFFKAAPQADSRKWLISFCSHLKNTPETS